MSIDSEVEIRNATIDDLAPIFHLGERVFNPQGFSNLYRTWDEFEVTNLFNSEPEYILVAEFKGKVVGFSMGTVIEKARSAWNYGHLLWLGVDPDFARMNIGTLLFERFHEIMDKEGIRMLMVDTQADNDPAIEFFQHKGFENPTEHLYMTLNMHKDG